MNQEKKAKIMLITSMVLFGTVGIFVRHLQFSSSLIALVRAVVGTVFLAVVLLNRGGKFDTDGIKKNLLLLIFSGIFLGFNWIALFESYRYTSVAVSTVCYYMAPVMVVAISPILLKETIRRKTALCILAALIGITLISGFSMGGLASGSAGKGILFGLVAAALYAAVILCNKRIQGIGPLDKTVFQLFIAAVTLLPYCMLSGIDLPETVDIGQIILLATVGIIHTGVTYFLYFSAMEHVSAQSIAVISYVDPAVAVLLSVCILGENLSVAEWAGVLLIFCAAFCSELNLKRE